MWEWLKRFGSMKRPSRTDALETAFLSQQKLVEKLLSEQQKHIAKQQETLDRVVASRFDRPIERIVHPVASDSMPAWALNDQGDVREPDKDPIAKGLASLHADSDSDFLESIQ